MLLGGSAVKRPRLQQRFYSCWCCCESLRGHLNKSKGMWREAVRQVQPQEVEVGSCPLCLTLSKGAGEGCATHKLQGEA